MKSTNPPNRMIAADPAAIAARVIAVRRPLRNVFRTASFR
jgi:hypothetical protein